jgi:GAF domain-containing protein
MRQRDKAGKTQRRKALMRNAPKAASRNRLARGKETNVARLTRERDELQHQQTAMSEILGVISNSPTDLRPVFDAILSSATRLCDGNLAALWRYDGQYLVGAAQYNASTEFADKYMSTKLELGRSGPARLAALERRTVHVADITAEPGFSPKILQFERARTVLAVPLLQKKELVGVVAIWRREVRPFTAQQIALVQAFAAQAVIAIENTRLLNELRQRTDDLTESLEQQTATSEVLSVISSSAGELQPVFETMLAKGVSLCDANFGAMWLVEGDGYRTAALYGDLPEAYLEQWRSGTLHRPTTAVPMMRAIRSRKPVHVPDMRKEKAYLEGDPLAVSAADVAGIRTLITVPMLKEGDAVGVITIYRKEVRPFSNKQIELVSNFAAQSVIAIENVRLLNELRESLQQQTATADVLKVISRSTFDLQVVLDTLVESAVRLCEAERGLVFRREGETYNSVAYYNYSPEFRAFHEKHPITPGRGTAVGRTALEGKSVQIVDILADPEYTFGEAQKLGGGRATLAVPLLRQGAPIGALSLQRTEPQPYSRKQIELVETFADQAVIAIENARLLSELRESLQQQTATADVLKVISRSTFDLQTVLETLTKSAAQLCEADLAAMTRQDGTFYYYAATYGYPPELDDYFKNVAHEPGQGSIIGRTILHRKTIHVVDVLADAEYSMAETAKKANLRSALGVPLLREGNPIGVILLGRHAIEPFTDKQIELVETFADQAVIAIENVRLFDEVQARTRDLTESLQQQTATADVLKVISRSTFDLQTVLSALIESAARLCSADQGAITREIDGTFFRAATYGHSLEFSDYIRETPVQLDRSSVAGRALVEGRIIHIPDVQVDPEYTFSPGLDLGNFRTVIGVPMLREGVPIGVLALSRKNVLAFTDKQIELVTTFADQAAIAIENVRLFNSVEARTRELAASLENLRTTQDRLVQTQKLASLGQLTAGIAHEIKNPLNFVNNFSAVSAELIDELRQVLAGAHLDNKLRKEITEIADTLQGNLDKVVQHGMRADAIVKNMLLHSREGSGENRLVDVNALVEESLNLAYHGARAEKQGFNITMERSLDPAAGQADVFPQDITRVLLNLISNGFYAATKRRAETGDGFEPTLVASTRNLGDRVEIRVRDNGSGISPEVKEKMFNPFFTTKPAGEGTGLGLSISHDIIVKQHGGSIEVETQPGEFTEIRVTLPRVAALLPERP